MLYDYRPNPDAGEGAYKLELNRVVGTTHSNLMTGSIYQMIPDRNDFCDRILANLKLGMLPLLGAAFVLH